MSSTRIESTITAESTTLANPDNDDEPMFVVRVLLQRKCEKMVSVAGGPQDLPVDEWQIAQHSPLVEIPCQLVTQPESCLVYLAYMISSFVFPSDSLSNIVASRIASFAGDLSRRGCFGFYVLAQVRVVEEIVDEVHINDDDDDDDDDDDHVDESNGAACAPSLDGI